MDALRDCLLTGGWLALALALCAPMSAQEATRRVQISHEPDRAEIGNGCLARTFALRPHLTTVAVTNRLSGRRFAVKGEEFVLDLGDGKTLAASAFGVEEVKREPDAGRLSFALRHPASGITARMQYELAPDAFFMRKRLSLDTGSVFVGAVEVERLTFEGAALAPMRPDSLNVVPVEPVNHLPHIPAHPCWSIGLGQPVFVADELFMGLEHPAGHNGHDKDGVLFLRHYPGQAGRIECKPAALGVATNQPGQRVRDAFLRYINGLKRRPVKRITEFFFDAHVFDDQARAIMDAARDALVQRGVHLDCITLNGWAEPSRGLMEPHQACPDFLKLMSDYAQKQLG
ncbi:MAG: hypothetical protein FJ272_11930, partial [Planctomycetes bacterium]|nr:hypothetical protein [Planctomycetota bacterium]